MKTTAINRANLFALVRNPLFGNHLKQSQVDGITAILDKWEYSGLTDKRWLAYMLATAYHETARTMQPLEEYGKGAKYPYGKHLKRSRVPYDNRLPLYYGRGLVQLTWYENYELMGRLLGYNLLLNPELACRMDVAVSIMFEGMTKGNSNFGDFTGRCLEMFFNQEKEDWAGARMIINGLDCAETIAGYGRTFYNALKN